MSLALSGSRPRRLQYAGGGLRSDMRLLEVDDALLADIAGGGVVIKGAPSEGAVLCTAGKTYALKHVETTNTLLMLPPDPDGDAAFAAAASQGPPDAAAVRDVGLATQLEKAGRAEGAPALVATATAAAHIEVVRCMPRLGQLRALLSSCRPYGLEDEGGAAGEGDGDGGEDGEDEECGGGGSEGAMDVDDGEGGGPGPRGAAAALGFTTGQLLARVQASRGEMLAELAALGAARLAGGRWRLVDEAYLGGLLEVLLLSATELGWPLGALPVGAACAALAAEGYRPALVRHCLKVFGAGASSSGDGSSSGGPEQRAALDRSRVCLHFARKLLHQGPPRHLAPHRGGGDGQGGGGRWRRSELLEAWARAVPEEWAPPDAGLLAGEALEELPEGAPPGAEPLLAPFAARDLPLDPAARFAALFRRRARWERAALEPYLSALVASGGGGPTVEALLLRHARASQATPDAPVLFSAR